MKGNSLAQLVRAAHNCEGHEFESRTVSFHFIF